MVINGYNIEIDTTELEFNERFEKAIEELQKDEANISKKIEKIKDDKNIRSKSIRLQCEAVFKFFDSVIGDHAKVFAGKVSLKMCLNALEEFVANVVAEDKAYSSKLEKTMGKYSVDRTKR